MTYTVALINGKKITINDEEYKTILKKDGKGFVVLSRLGVTINTVSIASIFPESKADELEERKKLRMGRAHDGTKLIRQFGVWYDMSGGINEEGHYLVKLDPGHYPEVAMDCVANETEWVELQKLTEAERLEKMIGGIKSLKSGDKEPTKLEIELKKLSPTHNPQ